MPPAAGFALGLAAMSAYWPGIAGASTAPRWCVIGVGSALLLFFADRIRITASHIAGLAFLAWCTLTLVWSVDVNDGIGALLHLTALAAAFALGSVAISVRPVLAGASLGMVISSAVVIAQWLGWDVLPSYHRPAGLFYNANYLGEAAALVIVGCIGYRLWTGTILAFPALIASFSRGAILALFVVTLVWLWRRWRLAAIIVGLSLLLIGAVAIHRDLGSLEQRRTIWTDTARAITWTGYGLGSYWVKFPKIAALTDLRTNRPQHAHNEVLHAAFELGWIGCMLLLVFAAMLIGPLTPERYILIALAIEAMFGDPLHEPATAFLGAIVAGHAASDRDDFRDQIVSCRDCLRRWLARWNWCARADRRA